MGASDWFRLHGLIYKKLAEAQSRLVEPCGSVLQGSGF